MNSVRVLTKSLPRITPSTLAISHKSFYDRYGSSTEEDTPAQPVIIRGRIKSKRSAGKRLFFIDTQAADGVKVQTVAKEYSVHLAESLKLLRKGDHVEITGIPGRTATGQVSIFASDITRLSSCQHRIPEQYLDIEKRLRHRHVDFLVNQSSLQVIKDRSTIIKKLRDFLHSRDFVELETPVLQSSASGATARPFETKSILGLDLQLKIAPEIALKRAVIGGLDRVFEIGKCFRNEGLSRRHNPEFTTCEFYQAYAGLEDLIGMTEDMLIELEDSIKQGSRADETRIFTKAQFKRIDFVPALEREIGQTLPTEVGGLLTLLKSLRIPVPSDFSIANLYDTLATRYLEPLCHGPTFIMNLPDVLSPLSKSTNGIAHRFELYVGGMELINAYEEENDAEVQRLKFKAQNSGTLTYVEEDYCKALEWGLPPTGGWGMGIDRLVMLLTDTQRINEVLLSGGIAYQAGSRV